MWCIYSQQIVTNWLEDLFWGVMLWNHNRLQRIGSSLSNGPFSYDKICIWLPSISVVGLVKALEYLTHVVEDESYFIIWNFLFHYVYYCCVSKHGNLPYPMYYFKFDVMCAKVCKDWPVECVVYAKPVLLGGLLFIAVLLYMCELFFYNKFIAKPDLIHVFLCNKLVQTYF